ncbi:MAG: prepilin-type N-terminal cleavage/methylation domain-containing protein [Armatimonadota bacterium]
MKKRGFTFLEVMIALLLLMIGIVFLLDLFPVALRNFRKAKDITMATVEMQNKLEEIRGLPEDTDIKEGEFNINSDPNLKGKVYIHEFEGRDDYKEVEVRVKNIISGAYANGSTVRRSSQLKGDMFTLTVPRSSPYYYSTIIFVTSPDDSKIYYAENKYGGGYYTHNSGWKPLDAPSGSYSPDQISASLCFVRATGPSGGVTVAENQIFLCVTDKNTKAVYGAVLQPNYTDSGINLAFARSWYELQTGAPCYKK